MTMLHPGYPLDIDDNPPTSNQYVESETFEFLTKPGRTHGISLRTVDATPAANEVDSVDTDTEIITATAAHGLVDYVKGQFTTTDTLPAGLSLLTDYWVTVVSSTEYKVSTSLANAKAGTFVNITDAGTGTHTFTPTSISASVAVTFSLDGTNFTNTALIDGATATVVDAITVGSAATNLIQLTDIRNIMKIRVAIAITAGVATFSGKITASI